MAAANVDLSAFDPRPDWLDVLALDQIRTKLRVKHEPAAASALAGKQPAY